VGLRDSTELKLRKFHIYVINFRFDQLSDDVLPFICKSQIKYIYTFITQ